MTLSTGRAVLVAMAATGVMASAVGARAVSMPAALASARQLVLVTTPDWNTVAGTLQTFERTSATAWTVVRDPVPIVVGKRGLAWDPGLATPTPGPVKAEGDGRSPAGAFALGTAFGFAPAAEARWLKLPYTEVTQTLECVDDPASGAYNTLADRAAVTPDWTSSEKMRQVSPEYRWGVVVEYNTRPAVARRGSCIFLHIASAGGTGTAGCTAMAQPALEAVMRWLDASRAPVLVQLPLAAYRVLAPVWRLPPLAIPR